MKMRAFLIVWTASWAGAALADTINFDNLKTGAPPPGWTATRTGSGDARWTIERDDTAPSKPNVLKQSGRATYPVCLNNDTSLKDGYVEVKLKTLSGSEDQAGGLLWRAQDSDNYYVARANALEDNVTIYHTIKGRRTEKKRANVKVAASQWHALRVDFQGTHFTVTFDGKKALEWDDETFKDAGKVGVWTKADSVTLFDDFSYGTAAAPVLQTVAEVPLPGAAVRFDYQALDQDADRLYVAHMNANTLLVFDVKNRKVVADLPGFENVHGVIAVPAKGRVYATVTGRHHLAVVDTKTLEVLARVGDIVYPDGLAYAPEVDRVFVSDEHGNADVVIDASTNQQLSKIPLGGEAGNTQYDPISRRILVAVHGKNELVSIDPASAQIVARTPLPGIDDPHGIALDVAGRLAFVAGEGNGMLAVVDLETLRVLETHKVADRPDVLAFDAGWRRLYVASESGGVNVFTEAPAGDAGGKRLIRDGDIAMPHAHSVSVDPRSHLVYFPLENVGGRPILRIMSSTPPRPR